LKEKIRQYKHITAVRGWL